MNERQLEKELKALANRKRLAIIGYLNKHPHASVGEIAEHLDLSFRSTSKHLTNLTNAGLVEKRQVGLNVQHKLIDKKSAIIISVLGAL